MIQNLKQSQSMQGMNFDKVQKIDNQCEMAPPQRSEGYYQSKYGNKKYSKDYAKSNFRQPFLGRGRGSLPKKSWKTRAASHMKH